MENANNILNQVVIKCISGITGLNECDISINHSLNFDLGIDGNDAVELIEFFSKEFEVDMSDFRFSVYFGPEIGLTPFSILMYFLSPSKKKKPLKVADLILSAKLKKFYHSE